MAQFLVLNDYQDTARKLPAGSVIDEAQYDMAELRGSGLALVLYDDAVMGPIRSRFLAQKAMAFAKPDLMVLVLLSIAGAASVNTSNGMSVEARL